MSTKVARHWRLNAQRYRLTGQTCPDCSQKIFPPRPICPFCIELAVPAFSWIFEEVGFPAHFVAKSRQDVEEISGETKTSVTVPTLMKGGKALGQLQTEANIRQLSLQR